MGSVWRAEHLDLGTPAAVKLIDESYVQSPEALARFRREAQAAASLRSANVVQILDYGIDGETPFIAMELLIGASLADRLERVGRIDAKHCAAILIQVSKALSRAHDTGIIHRDLKPDNIFLVREGDDEIAKVLDFGIAKHTGVLQVSNDLSTRTGSLMGTPYYMSPEQASGRREVDHRTDIWAFGVIAYECVTGQRPYDDSNLGGLLLNICTEDPPPASSILPVPPEFDQWFSRCTAKDPEARFATIREAATELCRTVGLVLPQSQGFSSSQSDNSSEQSDMVVQSITSPKVGSIGGASNATPGAAILTGRGGPAGTAYGIPMTRPWATIGIVFGISLLTLVAAASAWRIVARPGSARAASSGTVVAAEIASLVPPPHAGALKTEPSAGPSPSASSLGDEASHTTMKPHARQPLKPAPTRVPEPSVQRPQPQRTERDLGF